MSIFVGNLPFRAEREDVLQLFSPFGEVLNCSLPLERDTGRKRGFAFVEMADEGIETTAIEGLQGTELMGRPLRINKAEPRGSGGSRRGGRGGSLLGGRHVCGRAVRVSVRVSRSSVVVLALYIFCSLIWRKDSFKF